MSGYRPKSAARDLCPGMKFAKLQDSMKNRKYSVTYSADHDLPTVSGVTKMAALGNYGEGVKFTGMLDENFAISAIAFNSRGPGNPGHAC